MYVHRNAPGISKSIFLRAASKFLYIEMNVNISAGNSFYGVLKYFSCLKCESELYGTVVI